MRYHGQLRLPFSLLNNQQPGFFRLIGVEDDADEETQALHDQETGRSVPLHFDPAPSRYCNRGMVCLPVRIWSHAYDLCGKANPRTMWLWESIQALKKGGNPVNKRFPPLLLAVSEQFHSNQEHIAIFVQNTVSRRNL